MATGSEDDTELWDDAGFVASSTYRRAIFDVLTDRGSPTTPTTIAEESGKGLAHISRALTELRERDLVVVLNPDAKKGRLYTLTDRGEDVESRLDVITD